MIRTETPTEIQSAIAAALRPKLRLEIFIRLEPEIKRMHLEAASSFLTNPDARPTDKRAIVAFLEVLATVDEIGVSAIAQSIVDNWNNPL